MLPGRSGSSTAYRYGFQGQEKDDELKGEGNSLNYTFRMHDPRVGRFFAVDPLEKKYPNYTPYSFSGNKVIHAIELEGLEEWEINDLDANKVKTYGPYSSQESAQKSFYYFEVKKDNRFNFLTFAGGQIGVSEKNQGSNPKISEYHKFGGRYDSNEDEPWCASFANYSLLKGNPDYPRTNSPASSSFYLKAPKLQLEQVDEPYYGSIMVRSNNGKFIGGTGHVAFVVGKVDGSFAQLGGNQAKPGSSEGTTVNVVLRDKTNSVRFYHFTFLPKIPLGDSLFPTATKKAEQQKGTDR